VETVRYWELKAAHSSVADLSAVSLPIFRHVNIATADGAITDDLHLSNAEPGFALSAFVYRMPPSRWSAAGSAMAWVARRVLACFGLSVAFASILTASVGGMASLAKCRFLQGLGEAHFPASAMSRWLLAGRRGLAQDCSRLGNTLAPTFILVLITLWSWRGASIVAAPRFSPDWV
jgi:hypothetical protein